MKKNILLIIFFGSLSFSFSQYKLDKKDKKLMKKVENVNSDLNHINKNLADFGKKDGEKKWNSDLSRAILTKEERKSIDTSKDSLERSNRADSILQIIKKDKNRFMMLAMVPNMVSSVVPDNVETLIELFEEYGYFSKSRLNRLKITDKLSSSTEEIMKNLPSEYHSKLLSIIATEYNNNRLTKTELNQIENIIGGK